ncbi:16S rRNA (cytidine(1402)-2'-O)-methyltransferase [Elioraea sp.]|uniref:16S rRNA (cytidine(1402)-2'-O)-methyltransferase n=1 Tax=Elioraea sp. TaxID=2185103 RepID=UPI003F6FAA4A
MDESEVSPMHPPSDEAKRAAGPPGTLTLVATPIGNLGDMPARGIAVLAAVDAVLCEDTRVTAKLAARHGLAPSLIALHEHNEDAMTPRLLARLASGERLALVSDAGTPLVSDPGYRFVRSAIAAGHRVTAVPGPSAALAALAVSGLPPAPFLFLGFLPPRAGARRARIAELARWEAAGLAATLLLFEAPRRLGALLADLADVFGAARPAAVARELTKLFEEVARGTLGNLARRYAEATPRGEIVVVVGPGAGEAAADDAAVEQMLRAALARGLGVRDAAAEVAAATGRPRRDVYARALRASGRE